MALARADLEILLRARRLDRTLTTALAPLDPRDDSAVAPTGITALDASLGGGFPRGHLSELVGRRSSGRTSILLQTIAAATGRGELVAIVDALDMFDVESAAAAGVDFERLLWVRGHMVTCSGLARDVNQRAIEQAIRAFALVLQAGNFGLVVLDVAEAPGDVLRRLPFTTWLRLQRMVEGAETACLLVGISPLARSTAGVTVRLGQDTDHRAEGTGTGTGKGQGAEGKGQRAEGRGQTAGVRFGVRLFTGLDVEARAVRARACGPHLAVVVETRCDG
jgi:RecA DNA recombination protein